MPYKNLLRPLVTASAVFFYAGIASAQNAGTVTNHAFAVGKGPGVGGYTSLLCASAQLAVGQSAADPICQTITGDVTITAAGVTAIGANKVLNSMLATMAANTTKCNATGGSAVPTDCTASTMRTNLALVPGTDVQAFDADLAALAANSTAGLWAYTGAGTGAARTLTAPAAGLTISNPAGTAGNPTFALANDLAAVEGLSGTGIARRTGTDAWSVGTAVALSEMATQAAFSFVVNNTSGTAAPTAVDIGSLTAKASPATTDLLIVSDQAASGALKKSTVAQVVGALASGVSSIAGNTGAFTLGNGLTNSTNDLRVSLSTATNSLGADVAMNNTSNYFDGPSAAQGTSGTWFASGTVTINDPTNASTVQCKLWDGTTVISSLEIRYAIALNGLSASLSGLLASPAANIRISCKSNNTTTLIAFNKSGNSKDSTITAVRIAP